MGFCATAATDCHPAHPDHAAVAPHLVESDRGGQSSTDYERAGTAPNGLLGRDRELARLACLFETGPPGALVLRGGPGTGKSALLGAAAERAIGLGFTLLGTSGVATETDVAFAGLQRMLNPVTRWLSNLVRHEETALKAALGAEPDPAPEPLHVGLATLHLFEYAAARQRLAVVIDDVHLLDHQSQGVLAFVARRADPDGVVFLASVQNGHNCPILEAGLAELEVGALSPTASNALLQAHANGIAKSAQERILDWARGNPLALVELPKAQLEHKGTTEYPALPVTERLCRGFYGPYSALAQAVRDTLLVAAVDEQDEISEILSAASALNGHGDVAHALDDAFQAGLISLGERNLEFRHPVVRLAVLSTETSLRRRQAHAALAATLDKDEARAVWHRAHSVVGCDDDIAATLEAHHVGLARRGSALRGPLALERAASLTTEPSVRIRRLLLAAQQATDLACPEILERLLKTAAQEPLSELDNIKLKGLKAVLDVDGPPEYLPSSALCSGAQRAVAAHDDALALDLLLRAAIQCWSEDERNRPAEPVLEISGRLSHKALDPRFIATLALAEPVLHAREVTQLLRQIRPENVGDGDALRLLGMAAYAIADPLCARAYLDRSETRLRQQGRLGLLQDVRALQAQVRLCIGDWVGAAAAVREVRLLARNFGRRSWPTGVDVAQAMVDSFRAEPTAGGPDVCGIPIGAEREHGAHISAWDRMARGYAFITAGRPEPAYDAVRPLFSFASLGPRGREQFDALPVLAEAAAHSSRAHDARGLVDGLEHLLELTPSPLLVVNLSYAKAVLADDEQAEELYDRGLSSDLDGWPWPRARLQFAYGTWLRRQRRSVEARSPLRSALEVFEAIRAPYWAERARQELRASGDRSLSTKRAPLADLSPQELQIAQLAAMGLSNKQIGERLFLSHRTVGCHLYRVFPKLNVTSRTQLVSLLAMSSSDDKEVGARAS